MVDDNDETAGVLHDDTAGVLHDDTAGVLHDDNQLTKTKLKGTKVLR